MSLCTCTLTNYPVPLPPIHVTLDSSSSSSLFPLYTHHPLSYSHLPPPPSHVQTVQRAGCRQGILQDSSKGCSGGQYQSNVESKSIHQTLYHYGPRCSNGNSSVCHCTLLPSSHHCSLCGMQGLSEQGRTCSRGHLIRSDCRTFTLEV